MASHSARVVPAAQVEIAEPPVVLTPEEPANEEPVPEQEEPEATAPVPAVPTAEQLETTTSALEAPIEVPAMPPTEEQAAKRAALLKRLATLPEHLRLGVTLPGMRELLSQLPSDAVE